MKTGAIDERHGPVANSNEEDPPESSGFCPLGVMAVPQWSGESHFPQCRRILGLLSLSCVRLGSHRSCEVVKRRTVSAAAHKKSPTYVMCR